MDKNQPNPAQQASDAKDDGLAAFTEYFCRNYPGPDTIIGRPEWHAPELFRAAKHAIEAARELTAAQGVCPKCKGRRVVDDSVDVDDDGGSIGIIEPCPICAHQPIEPQGAVVGDLEIAETALQRFHDKFMERAHVDPSTGYPEYGSQEDYYIELCAALDAVKALQDVSANPREQEYEP